MKLKRTFIFLLVLSFLLLLFVPIPCGREEKVLCTYKPGFIGQPCPKEGDIKWCPSVYDSILSILGISNRTRSVLLNNAVNEEVVSEEVQKNLCILKGGEWDSCLGAFGPCGCAQVYSDGGKSCTRGKDCSSRICIISSADTADINGLYTGKCPQKSFELGCGKAEIEDGKIVKDLRDCVY